jgi:hypothetical protein
MPFTMAGGRPGLAPHLTVSRRKSSVFIAIANEIYHRKGLVHPVPIIYVFHSLRTVDAPLSHLEGPKGRILDLQWLSSSSTRKGPGSEPLRHELLNPWYVPPLPRAFARAMISDDAYSLACVRCAGVARGKERRSSSRKVSCSHARTRIHTSCTPLGLLPHHSPAPTLDNHPSSLVPAASPCSLARVPYPFMHG